MTYKQASTTGIRRVVVTGCGVVSPVGLTTDRFWEATLAGVSGVSLIDGFDVTGLVTRIAGQIRGFEPTDYIDKRQVRRLDKFALYGIAATLQAIEQAGLVISKENRTSVAILVGSGYGAGRLIQQGTEALISSGPEGPRRRTPYLAATGSVDNASTEIARLLDARGPSGATATACATGTTCIGDAMRMIRHGYAEVVIAGGADDSITRLDVIAASAAGALSQRNDEPSAASRPFDRARDGFVMAAGAGVVILEEADSAERRGATILAEVIGYGASTDTYHPTAPDPSGQAAVMAMRGALGDANLDADQVDYINAHGTGTKSNDTVESAAIRSVLGTRAEVVPIGSTKSMTGHMIGAAGAVEFIACIYSIMHNKIAPTINCDDPEDPKLDYILTIGRKHLVDVAMSNSFGFGGHNAVLVVKKFE